MSRRRHPIWKSLVVMAADFLAVGAGLLFAYWLRFYSNLVAVEKGFYPSDYLRLMPWLWAFWFVSLRFEGLHRRRARPLDFNVVRRVLTGSALALLLFFAFAFYERPDPQYSRKLVPILYFSVVATVSLARLSLHLLFRWLVAHRQIGLTRTLILGGGEIAEKVYDTLRRHPEHGMAPIGALVDRAAGGAPREGSPMPVLGDIEELESILESRQIEEVILAQPELERSRIPHILVQCERNLADFRIVPDTTELLFSGMVVETMGGVPFLGVRETPLQGWNAALKRMLDFCAALAGLVALSPILALVAWLVKRQDGGPALYVQERMGLDGRRFKICKFRTMRLDAENESGPVFADDDDPRCTPLGSKLRKWRIDEFPQLWNVVMGDMSLVGPRPERPFFVEQFRDDVPRYMARHKVKSGMTGWAQIHGLCGKHGSIAERLKYDLYYVENWTLWLDVKILLITFFRAALAR